MEERKARLGEGGRMESGRMTGKITYEIMHMDRKAACIDTGGRCHIYEKQFMPYNLYLEEGERDIDILVNNITNFYYWCATRVLTLDRQYAKEILNSIGVSQAVTDRERAQVALSYHCLSLTDVYWVRKAGEEITFREINLYQNHLDNAFVNISLRGKQMTAANQELAKDLSTNGCFPKAWLRQEKGFVLLKDGGGDAVDREILASRICRCFRCSQVLYKEGEFEGQKVSVSEIMTTQQYGILSREAFEIYAVNEGIDPMAYILQLDGYSYYMMNILDYLVGNTDRHWGNWGFLVDNRTNRLVRLHPLMDFNRSFHSYGELEGANCQTVLPEIMTQREAAVQAVRQIGLNRIGDADGNMDIKESWFHGMEQEYAMFRRRLDLLESIGR